MDKNDNNSIFIPLTTPHANDYELGGSDEGMNYSQLKLDLIKMAYKEELIDMLNLFFQPQSVEDAIGLMSKDKGVWQHNFIEDEGNKCLICHEETDHIDKKLAKANEDYNYNLIEDNTEISKRISMTYDLILEKINNRKYNALEEEENRQSTGEHTCDICMEEIVQDEKKHVKIECQHYFCSSCWFEYFNEKIKNGEVNIIVNIIIIK